MGYVHGHKETELMRIAFTILYNGYHHLTHQGFNQFMTEHFDYWIVIEGLAGSGGSTSWCNNLPLSPRSTDGSHELMTSLSASNPKVIYYSPGSRWASKDAMVSESLRITRMLMGERCYLWQVDADEIWEAEALDQAEQELEASAYTAGSFQFDHYLCATRDGRQLVGRGEWGSGYNTRLWLYRGEKAVSHEPPIMQGQTLTELSPRYRHYSYYFEKDVAFKSLYYKGHEFILDNWRKLKDYKGALPVSISYLFGPSRKFNHEKSFIDCLK